MHAKSIEKKWKEKILEIKKKYNNLKKEKSNIEVDKSKDLKNLEEMHNKAIKELESL